MEVTCSRCHQAIPEDSCFCPTCGLPQIVYSSDGAESPADGEPWTETVRDAGSVDWKPALRAAMLLAVPACLLFCALIPVGFLSFLWMGAVAALTVTLYSRKQSPAWLTLGAGARIGLVSGIITGWLVFVLVAAMLFSARYLFHQGPAIDDIWKDIIARRLDPQWQASGMDARDVANMNTLLFSAEGRSGTLLFGLGLIETILLLCAAAGGALGARMMIRSRRPLQ